MPKEECRESRPVPFSPSGAVWEAAVAEDSDGNRVMRSTDVDSMGRLASPVLTPYQRQQPPMVNGRRWGTTSSVWDSVTSVRGTVNGGCGGAGPSGAQPPVRPPLAPVSDPNVIVLGDELRALELRVECQAKQIKLQHNLIRGLCSEVARRP